VLSSTQRRAPAQITLVSHTASRNDISRRNSYARATVRPQKEIEYRADVGVSQAQVSVQTQLVVKDGFVCASGQSHISSHASLSDRVTESHSRDHHRGSQHRHVSVASHAHNGTTRSDFKQINSNAPYRTSHFQSHVSCIEREITSSPTPRISRTSSTEHTRAHKRHLVKQQGRY
jgi:hypothetical protein